MRFSRVVAVERTAGAQFKCGNHGVIFGQASEPIRSTQMISAAMNLHGDFRRQRCGLSVESPMRGGVRPLGALCSNSDDTDPILIRGKAEVPVWCAWKKTIVENRVQHAAASDRRMQACVMQRIPACFRAAPPAADVTATVVGASPNQ